MPVIKDRRSSLRVEVEGRALIHTNRDEFAARCVDLGLDGIAIRSTRSARPGERVTVEAWIAGQLFRIEAKLIRRQRTRGEYLLGLAFVDLDFDTQRRIEHTLFERLAGSPQGEFMRAFVAHAERVPPPVVREAVVEHTVVAGVLPVPVISGHTQIIALDQLPTADRTVIAPPPPRIDVVRAEMPALPPEPDPGVPDDAWLDDEMDTAQFRLLEAAQAKEREAAEREATEVALELEPELEPLAPPPEHTVVVTGFATSPDEGTAVTTDVLEPSLRERTLVTSDAPEPSPRERTLVTSDAPEPSPRERTLVTSDAPEPSSRKRTLVTSDGPEPSPRERTLVTSDSLERPPAERLPEATAERTLPFLRDLFPDPTPRNPASQLAAPERTAIVSARLAADSAVRPTLRALLDAAALLRGHAPGKRGPRVVVAVPHRTYRRVASTPWNDQ